jgi:hypothetical protein
VGYCKIKKQAYRNKYGSDAVFHETAGPRAGKQGVPQVVNILLRRKEYLHGAYLLASLMALFAFGELAVGPVLIVLALALLVLRSHDDQDYGMPNPGRGGQQDDIRPSSRIEDHGHDHVPARSHQTFGAAAGHRVARAVAMFGSVLTLLPSGHLVMARSATHA